jgi:predicted nuclease of predicted toxin-antitoxin system
MRAKCDENLPVEAARLLTEAGWNASTVHDEGLAGAPDDAVSAACVREERVLFSLDLDFADIRRYPPESSPGIVILRPPEPHRSAVLALLSNALPVLSAENVKGCLCVVEPGRIRIRGRAHP